MAGCFPLSSVGVVKAGRCGGGGGGPGGWGNISAGEQYLARERGRLAGEGITKIVFTTTSPTILIWYPVVGEGRRDLFKGAPGLPPTPPRPAPSHPNPPCMSIQPWIVRRLRRLLHFPSINLHPPSFIL